MDYENQVYIWLKSIKPGSKIDITQAKEPDKLKTTIKYLMDGDWIIDFSFSNDYKFLKRQRY